MKERDAYRLVSSWLRGKMCDSVAEEVGEHDFRLDVVGSRLYFASETMGRPDFEGHLVEVKSEPSFDPKRALDQIKKYASLVEGIPQDRRWSYKGVFTFGRLHLHIAAPNLTEYVGPSLDFREGRIGVLSMNHEEGKVEELVEAQPIWNEEGSGYPYGPSWSVYGSRGVLVESIDHNPILGKLYDDEDVWKEIDPRTSKYPRK